MTPAKEFEGELWIKAADFHWQKKEWVGLTDEEVAEAGRLCIEGERMLPYSFSRAIEQALKEKNT